MSTQDRQSEEIRALERLLEVYGADRTRWPARERLQFASLIANNPAAQRLVAETAALDRLLDQVSTENEERERALSERIMAAARVQQHEPDRVQEPASAASRGSASRGGGSSGPRRRRERASAFASPSPSSAACAPG